MLKISIFTKSLKNLTSNIVVILVKNNKIDTNSSKTIEKSKSSHLF